MADSGNMAFANTHIVTTYAKFRPAPPASLINTVVGHVSQGRLEVRLCGSECVVWCGVGVLVSGVVW